MTISEYSKWFWSECDELNKDTSFAHSLAEKAWDYQQYKVDELTLQVAETKSRLNDAYTDGQISMYKATQSKVDELQKCLDAALYVVKQGISKQGSNYYLEKLKNYLRVENET